MLNRKDIQFKLLQKFVELCRKADVKYALHGHVAYQAYREEEFNELRSLEVIMCQGDAEKIVDLLDDDEFYFEDFRSNPKFDKHYMMFGYKNSLDLRVRDLNFIKDRHIENHCIRINIHFVENYIKEGRIKPIRYKNRLWRLRYVNVSSDIPKLYYGKKVINSYYDIKGTDRSIKSRYDFKKKKFSIRTWDEIKNYPIVRFTGVRFVNSELFDELETKDLDGIPVTIFKDFELYAYSAYGRKWEEKEWASTTIPLSSSVISWEEYSKNPEVKKCIDEIQNQHEYLYKGTAKSKGYRAVTRNMRRNVIQSGDIIHSREEFIPRKDELFEIYKSGDLVALEREIKPLIQYMQNGIRIGYTYSVDEDIDNLLDSYLRDVDRGELADRIKKLRIDI